MRTTVELDSDTAKAIERARREQGIGVSEAVNALIRRGLMAEAPKNPFRPIHHDLGVMMDISNVADALDLLEGPHAR